MYLWRGVGRGVFSDGKANLMCSHRARLRAILVVLAGLAAAAPAAGPTSRLGEKYALLVGVRQYNPNELRNLPFAERDVETLAQVLLQAGYRKENVTLMTHKTGARDADLLPTAANIRAQLQLLLRDRQPGHS